MQNFDHTPSGSRMVCHPWSITSYDQPMYKFEVSIFSIHYKDIKSDTKYRKWGDLG